MRLSGDYFWGFLLISIGAILLLKYLFNVNIPMFRTIVGLVLIYCGLMVIIGGYSVRSKSDIIFDNGRIKSNTIQKEYNMVFSGGVVDLTDMPTLEKRTKIEVNSIFAGGTLIVDKDVPVVIKASAVFGQVRTPEGTSVNFGDNVYTRGNVNGDVPYLEIEANAVFGQLNIIEK